MLLEVALAAVCGLLIGSFLNVCIYRLPRGESVIRPRSHCPECKKLVRSWDNVPVLSYLVLGGRCRDCGAPISWRYTFVEVALSLLFGLFVFRDGLTVIALRECVLSALLLALTFTDLETRILPEELTFGGIALGFLFAFFVSSEGGLSQALFGVHGKWASLLDSALGAVVPAGTLWLTGWIFERLRGKQGLGLGDVILLAEIGAFLGVGATLLTLVLASVAGASGGLAYIYLKREDPGSYQLPLGSFLGVAGIVVLVWGRAITQWYVGVWG